MRNLILILAVLFSFSWAVPANNPDGMELSVSEESASLDASNNEAIEEIQMSEGERAEWMISRGELRHINMKCTAYTIDDCDKSPSDPDYGIMTNGKYIAEGYVAAGEWIPFGTKIYIEGYGIVVVEDRGGGIGDYDLDIVFSDRSDALEFGVQIKKVYILGRDEDSV